MPKYRVSLTTTIDAYVWVECSDPQEAKSIAENAWRPKLDSAGIDPTIHAVYDYDVDMHARDVTAGDIEEWGDM